MITEKLIIKESGQYDPEIVARLSLDGFGIKVIQNLSRCTSIIELSLRNNEISMITGLESLSTLTKLDLSFNKIKKIDNLTGLLNLQYLDLRRNYISNIADIEHLQSLQQLNALFLQGIDGEDANPVCQNPSYVTFILRVLPQLCLLDGMQHCGIISLILKRFNYKVFDLAIGGHLQILEAFQSLEEHMAKVQPDPSLCVTPPMEPWFDFEELSSQYPIHDVVDETSLLESKVFRDLQRTQQQIEDVLREDCPRLMRKSQSLLQNK